jgi:VIT1/CCC1 family predicted Fe2+/Mn2+ transporter
MSTAWDKFQGATLSLARSGSIKDRLTDAYRNHLSAVAEEELPREIREQFHDVRCSLTREQPQRGEDAIRATVRKMSSHEAETIAEKVVQMLAVMARTLQSTRTPAAAPLYLLEA